jgi:cellulose synthase/poly-beta-1,6-N-acetylglucosamine synthase-like glycosyltransferase
MIAVFWLSIALLAYTYVGYALIIRALARRRTGQTDSALTPPLTVVIAAYNEASRIAARVRNVLEQDYPAQNLSVIVVSDGSTDGTERAAAIDDPRVRVIALTQNGGKAVAVNAALESVRTEFVVFTDARQRFAPDALKRLLAPFADAHIGAVSGELEIVENFSDADRPPNPAPIGLYWRMEKSLRDGEAGLGWLHGVSGAIYALRRELFAPLPAGTILDDMWVPLHVVFAGRRIAMARDAVAFDSASAGSHEEFRRKVRTLAGNWQLIARMPRLLVPWRNPVWFAWVSHKFLRLIAPWALIAAWFCAAFAPGNFYRAMWLLQTIAYAVALFALIAPRSAAKIPLLTAAGSFLMLNAAACLALPASLALDPRGLWKKH